MCIRDRITTVLSHCEEKDFDPTLLFPAHVSGNRILEGLRETLEQMKLKHKINITSVFLEAIGSSTAEIANLNGNYDDDTSSFIPINHRAVAMEVVGAIGNTLCCAIESAYHTKISESDINTIEWDD